MLRVLGKKTICVGLLLVSVLLVACAKPDFEQAGIEIDETAHVSVINLANTMILSPAERLAAYTEAGHVRMLAYQSMEGLKVPGFKGDEADQAAKYFGFELAPGMGDQLFSDEHRQLQLYFIDYADRYNHLLLIQAANAKDKPKK